MKDHANLQEQEDIEFINQEKRSAEKNLADARQEAETKKKGSIAEAEAKSKQKVEEFSGFNAYLLKLQNLDKQVREKY